MSENLWKEMMVYFRSLYLRTLKKYMKNVEANFLPSTLKLLYLLPPFYYDDYQNHQEYKDNTSSNYISHRNITTTAVAVHGVDAVDVLVAVI